MEARIPSALLARLRPIRVDEYHRLIDAGALREDEHVELLEGAIVEMGAHGVPHALAVQRLQRLLEQACGDAWVVRTQLPLTLGERSEPEPDLALVAASDADGPGHPTRAALVVEVAQSSLADDRDVKGPLYARAGIAEYWIVDVSAPAIHVHEGPLPGEARYASVRVVAPGAEVSPRALPSLRVTLAALVR